MKRFVALIMVLAMSLGLIGCVPARKPQGDGNDVIININLVGAGYGTHWLKESKSRFEQQVAAKKYGENDQYEGVFISIASESDIGITDYDEAPYHILFGGAEAETSAAYSDLVLNLAYEEEGGINVKNEIYNYTGVNSGVKSIFDLIREDDKANYVTSTGEVYGLPTFELFVGSSYDKDLFDAMGYYFADPTKTSKTIKLNASNKYTPLLDFSVDGQPIEGYEPVEFYLVNQDTDLDWESHKSVGPDGKTGIINGVDYSLDDGLPSSLLELIALCNYMKKKDSVYPLQFTGKYAADYADNFIYGLVYSLLGEDGAKTTRSFTGDVDVLVSFTGEEGNSDPTDPIRYLLPTIKGIRLPKTEKVSITEETGFYTFYSQERYYAMALIELFKQQDWLAPGSNPLSNSTDHKGAQNNFIYSNYKRPGQTRLGQKIAFLSESSFWYNEAKDTIQNFKNYNKDGQGQPIERDVRWYSYPVNIANTVTGEETTRTTNGVTESVAGKTNVIPVSKMTMLSVNKAAIEKEKDSQAVLDAVRDFLEFWYSEDELINTTVSQGMGRNMNFKMPTNDNRYSQWAGFYKNLNELKEQSYVLPFSGNNRTFMENTSLFKLGEGGNYFSCHRKFTMDLFDLQHTAIEGFEKTVSDYTPEIWKGYYKGTADKSTIDYIYKGGVKVDYRGVYEDLV